MDDLDKNLLNALQNNFEITSHPYRQIATLLGIEEAEVLERIKKLKETGVIRRIGAVFDGKALGFVATLCAAKVDTEKIDEFVAIVNSYPNVTHNYLRNHEYNIWFTISAPNEAELIAAINAIKTRAGVSEILSLRSKQTFKLDARFEM